MIRGLNLKRKKHEQQLAKHFPSKWKSISSARRMFRISRPFLIIRQRARVDHAFHYPKVYFKFLFFKILVLLQSTQNDTLQHSIHLSLSDSLLSFKSPISLSDSNSQFSYQVLESNTIAFQSSSSSSSLEAMN